MQQQSSRERARVAALERLQEHSPDPRVRELARLARAATLDAAQSVQPHGARVERLRERQVRTTQSRRRRATLGGLVLATLAGATIVSTAAVANPEPKPNSVVAVGRAPQLGAESGLALRAGVVAIAGYPTRPGYWLAGADGGVFAFGHAPYLGSLGDKTLNAPIVGIAATPSGNGYWLVGSDGGVFAFGDAKFYGSLGGRALSAPVTALVAAHDGRGYWLIGKDGGVFSFGTARYHGSTQGRAIATPIVGAAATRTGNGYWLVGEDGGVFAFGDARFFGSQPDPGQSAVGIAAEPHGRGYWIAYADGGVSGFGAPLTENTTLYTDPNVTHPQTVAIATSRRGGYWLAQGEAPPVSTLASDPFLACTRAHESDGAGGYQAVSAGGTYRGAYQFDRSTWDSAADLAGRPDLIGVDPAAAPPADQDFVALALYHSRGTQPWGGRCGGLS